MKTNLLLTVIFIFTLWGCNNNKAPENQTSKVVCVLFDISETTNTPEIRKVYLDKFKSVLKKMHPGDAIEAALITEKSLSELELSIECEFPVIESKANTELFEKEAGIRSEAMLKLKIDSLLSVADSLLFKPKRKIPFTEIMGSLQVAERVIKSFPQPKKIVVIFSDMIEDSQLYNFNRESLTDKRINKIISIEKGKKLLPDLKNVKVYIAGAAHPDTDKYNRIRNFWIKYFKETGANLAEHHYGAVLINFEE